MNWLVRGSALIRPIVFRHWHPERQWGVSIPISSQKTACRSSVPFAWFTSDTIILIRRSLYSSILSETVAILWRGRGFEILIGLQKRSSTFHCIALPSYVVFPVGWWPVQWSAGCNKREVYQKLHYFIEKLPWAALPAERHATATWSKCFQLLVRPQSNNRDVPRRNSQTQRRVWTSGLTGNKPWAVRK